MKDVMLVVGARQISMAISQRMGHGKKIILGDKSKQNCVTIAKGQKYGEIRELLSQVQLFLLTAVLRQAIITDRSDLLNKL